MADTSQYWADQTCLSLWILGHRSQLLSVRDVWRLTLSKTVILMTLALGAIVALTMTMSHMTAGDQTFYLQAPFIVIPLLVTIASSALLSAVFYFRYRKYRKSSTVPDVITVPVTLIGFIACTPFIFLFNGMKYLAEGLSLEAFLLVVVICPFFYTLISDYIHFLIVQYVAPSILGRPPINPPDTSDGANKDTVLRRFSPIRLLRAPVSDDKAHKQHKEYARWSDTVCLSMWICGQRSSLMSVRELWSIVFSGFVLTLSIVIGSAAGVASTITLMAVEDETYYVLMLFCIAPVFVNMGSAALMSVNVFIRLTRMKDDPVPIIVVPTALTIYAAAVPIVGLIYALKVAAGGLGENWAFYVMTITPVVYVLISDFFHYVVFFFVAPSVWGRAHVYEPIKKAGTPRAQETLEEHVEPPVAVLLDSLANDVLIGNTTFAAHDLVLLEAQGNYLRVVTNTVECLERFRISAAVEQLSDNLGVLLHRSYWVAFSGIASVSFQQGQCKIQTTSGEIINVASTRQDNVITSLKERGLIEDHDPMISTRRHASRS